jgi:capsule polysaccharide export protein KpsE/RkpR
MKDKADAAPPAPGTYQLVYAIPANASQGTPDGIDLTKFALRIWRAKALIVGCVTLAVILSIAIALATPNKYRARIVALPPVEKSTAGGLKQYADMASLAGISLPGGGGAGGSADEIMAILGSRTLQGPLIEEFGLAEYYGVSSRDELFEAFGANFLTIHDKKSKTILISYEHTNPELAAKVANRAADRLQDVYNQIHQGSSRRQRLFLEGRLTTASQDLEAAHQRFADFQRQHNTIEIKAQTEATIEAVGKLQGQLLSHEIELKSLTETLGSADNPQVALLQARVEHMTRSINSLVHAGKEDEGESGALGAGVLLNLGQLPDLSYKYLNLYRDVRKNEELMSGLLAQVESARLAEVRDAEIITVLDPAEVPTRRAGPARTQMCLTGTFLGVVIGLLLALSWEPLRSHLRRKSPRPE